MLESLAGRLRWEKTADSVRIELPGRLGWRLVLDILFPAALLALLKLAIDKLLSAPARTSLDWGTYFSILAGLVLGHLSARLGRRTIVTLTPAELTVNWGIFETRWNRRRYEAARLHDLRYTSSDQESEGHSFKLESVVRVGVDDDTAALFRGVTEEEAAAVIEKMTEVYPFPHSQASGDRSA